jgi:tetratricopeptide (TPR) repeat protein
MRFIAKSGHDPMRWYTLATLEAPNRREPFVDFAQYLHDISDWQACLLATSRALQITEKQMEYLCEAEAWGARPHDLASIALWRLEQYPEAVNQCQKALEYDPANERLQGNLKMMLFTAEID